MIAALGVAKHLRPSDVCRFAVLFSSAVLLIGFAAACANGSFLYGDAYRFSGTLHPNSQAVNCAILCLASLALFCDQRETGRYRWRWLLLFVVGLFFLMLTRSRTTTVAFAAGLLALLFVGASWPRKLAIVFIPAMAVVLGALLYLTSDSPGGGLVMEAIQMGRGDDDLGSLTGRIPIWQAVASDIAHRPLLGYGYGSFWTAQKVWEYSFIRHWEFNHAHSAYLETLLNIGVIGLMLGLLIVVWTGLTAAIRYTKTCDIGYRFIAAMIVLAMVNGLVDSNFVIVGFAPLLIMICVSTVALHGEIEHETGMSTLENPSCSAYFPAFATIE